MKTGSRCSRSKSADGTLTSSNAPTGNEVAFAGCVRDTDFEVLKKGSNWGWFSRKISDAENVAILNELIRTRSEWASPS
jgi:hypothetical protein